MAEEPSSALAGPDSQGKLPKTRAKDAAHAHSVYKAFKDEDRESAIQRTKIQAMFDGERPYSEGQLRAAGQAYRCNLNFGEADAMKEDALSSYVDLINSEESLIRLETSFGEPSQRSEWSDVIALEYTRMVKNWTGFFPWFMLNAEYFVAHGVSVNYFHDSIDWRWDVARFGEFQIPRGTKAREEEIDVAFLEREFNLAQLNEFIQRPGAKEEGWNIKAVKKAMQDAGSRREQTDATNQFEAFQEDIKNNDIRAAHTSKSVKIVHCWVKEFNGSVSHGIMLQKAAQKEWLFWKPGRFKSMTNAFVVYTYGVGDGYYHSIRGLGYKIFYHDNVANRMLCTAVDGANLRNSLLVQPEDENDLDKLTNMVQIGPVSVMAPGLKAFDAKLTSGDAAMGMVDRMRGFMRGKTDQYNPQNALPEGGPEKSRAEIVARLQQGARLSDSAKGLFYEPDTRMHREVFRRVMRKSYRPEQAGGPEVQRMRRRLIEAGVPLEALFAVDIDSIRSVRAVGSGSPAAKELSTRQIMDLAGGFPETGRNNAVRDAAAAALNGDYDAVNRYIPRQPTLEAALPVKDAMLENMLMDMGKEIEVVEGELHLTHANICLQSLQENERLIQEEGVEPMELAEIMSIKQAHGAEHVRLLADNPTSTEDAAILRQAYQQFNESINNGINQLQAAQEEAQNSNGGGEPSQEQIDHQEKLRMQAEEAQLKLQILFEAAEAKNIIAMAAAQQKRAIADADAAAKLSPSRLV